MVIRKLTDFSAFEAIAIDEERSCNRKYPYRSESYAIKVAELMTAKHKEAFRHYKCRYANHYHVGHIVPKGKPLPESSVLNQYTR